MLSLNNRLNKKSDFARTVRFGQRFFTQSLKVYILDNGLKKTRAGVVVGTKFSPKATQRNQMKRLLREAIKQIIPKLEEGKDIVISAPKKSAKTENLQDLIVALDKVLKKYQIK